MVIYDQGIDWCVNVYFIHYTLLLYFTIYEAPQPQDQQTFIVFFLSHCTHIWLSSITLSLGQIDFPPFSLHYTDDGSLNNVRYFCIFVREATTGLFN